VDRERQIEAIVEVGRRTRPASPRWLWIAAVVVGVICATGFVLVMLAHPEPADPPVQRRAAPGPGLGTGLVVGAAAGVAIGFALGRHRRDHSSRNRP
jgi:drug/metabolite transporter (DMT)-like permease